MTAEPNDSWKRVLYHHAILAGPAYAVGWQQGEWLAQAGRQIVSYDPPEPEHEARTLRALYDAHCPGLVDEVRGVAERLGISEERALFCATVADARGCSQAAILPPATTDGHLYACRVYDFALDDSDLRLCTTRVAGMIPHLGFSEMLFGRNEGLNAAGLCVTASVPWGADAPSQPGLHYAIVIRALLERCRSVSEALAALGEMPVGSAVNLLLSDRAGSAALVEIASAARTAHTLGGEDAYAIATNHLTLTPTAVNPNSHQRYEAFAGWITAHRGAIDAASLMLFLDREGPEGVCGWSREMQMGSLWAVVSDVTTGQVFIRCGPPPRNVWHTYGLEGAAGWRPIEVWIPA